MAIRELKDQIARLPEQPGVYLYLNAADDTIYVGKARALRDRVRNYLGAYGADAKTDALLDEITRVEVIVTDSVVEALALENHLIKKHQPRFNVKLRDDKQYLVLRVDPRTRFPRVEAVRNIRDDGARYFGPYHSATSCRATLRLLNRHFQLRTCTDHVLNSRTRPCILYQIKRCSAPCVGRISEEEYRELVDDAVVGVENVLRRLRRLARAYGTEPRFVLTSATIANPLELGERLTGLELGLVDRDGAPHAERQAVMWNPPLADEDAGIRGSALSEAAQ